MRNAAWKPSTAGMPQRGGLCIAALALVVGALFPSFAADRSFTPEGFFTGRSVSAGTTTTLLVSRSDFTAEFSGTAQDGRLRLDERFHFADGERLQRWDLRRISPGAYRGTVRTEGGDGVLRPAVPVTGRLTQGGAVLDYVGYAPGGGDTLLHFRHHMTAQPDGTVRNRVSISKFGLPVARADVTFAKSEAALAGG